MRRLALTVVAAFALAAAPATADVTTPRCTDASASGSVFARVGVGPAGWTENLGFDGRGGLWVSEALGKVVEFDPDGHVRASMAVDSPGAIVLPPNGRSMYANFGDSSAGAIAHAGAAGVVRFDPTAARPSPSTFVSGLQMANGAAFDNAGNLYVSDTANGIVTRIRPTGAIDPAWSLSFPGANGLAIANNALYVTSTTDPTSPIERVPLDDPGAAAVIVRLAGGLGGMPPPKVLDDLAVGPDGKLYVATALGELVRVDRNGLGACVLYTGPPLTSVRFAAGFKPYDARTDLFATSESGVVLRLKLRPA